MTYIIIINKNGKVKDKLVKDISEPELFRAAGYKTGDGFSQLHAWKDIECKNKNYKNIMVWGKTRGGAGKENKYDLPPPIDVTLYFGSIVIVHSGDDNSAKDLRVQDWSNIYDSLMGGFDDLDNSEEESEEEYIDPSRLDKYGYEKDGFVVDDDDEIETTSRKKKKKPKLVYDSELSEDAYFD